MMGSVCCFRKGSLDSEGEEELGATVLGCDFVLVGTHGGSTIC